MLILVLNAGSSSLKYQLIDMNTEQPLAVGVVGRISLENSTLTHRVRGEQYVIHQPVSNHTEAVQIVLNTLQDKTMGVIRSMDEIGAVGHRVLHGGTEFSESVIINDEVKAAIRKCIPLGPLHNPANLAGIEACENVIPCTPQVAVFDTAFNHTIPAKAYMYGVPKKYHDELGVRRYGFHGTSYRWVNKRACEFMGIPQEGTKVVICHLGNGSSLSACVDGKCVDTSMGLTPLEGLLMGTRCGSCDPAVVQFIANSQNMTIDQVLDMMNKESGLLGISGISSDVRDVDAAADVAQAVKVAVDAKTQALAVCNATETLLVHRDIAKDFLPVCVQALTEKGVEIRGDERTRAIVDCTPATEADWAAEYLDAVLFKLKKHFSNKREHLRVQV